MQIEIDEQSVIKQIESEWTPDFDSESIFKEAFKIFKDTDREQYYKHIAFCLSFRLDPLEKNFFKHRYEVTLEDGNKKSIPDPKDITEEVLSSVRDFVNKQNNPHLNSRLFDILWSFESKNRKQLNDRLKAISYYQQSANDLINEDIPFAMSVVLSRQLTLANQTGDQTLIDQSNKFLSDHIEKLRKAHNHSDLRKVLEYLIQTNKTNGSIFTTSAIRTICEGFIFELKTNDSIHPNIIRQFLNIIGDSYRCEGDENSAKATMARIAQSFVEEGDEKEKVQGSFAKIHSYSEAIKIYNEIGGYNSEVDKLKVGLTDGNKQTINEMEHHEISQSIPKAAIDAVNQELDAILDLEPETALFTFCQFDILPAEEKLREETLNLIREFPLSHFFDTRVFNNHLEVKIVKEDEEKILHGMGKQFHFHINLNYQFKILPFFDKFFRKHSNFDLMIMEIYNKSPFKNDLRLPILKSGLASYRDKRFVDCAHVLCPLIEGVIRDMLALIKAPIVSIRGNHQKARDFGDMLITMKVVLADDPHVVYFLEMFYCEFYGYNFRNALSHGLIDGKQLENRFYSDMLIFTVILLLSYAPKDQVPEAT